MKALYALRDGGPTEAQAQRLNELLQSQDEDGMFAVLEGATLHPLARKKLEVLKKAKLVGDRLTELSRTIPLPHDKIQALYPEIRDLRTEYDRLSTEADRYMTRV
jgi:ubiquinone biosynthesis protein UbiJ